MNSLERPIRRILRSQIPVPVPESNSGNLLDLTPDNLRGRVSAINFVFIGFSNEFGAFESGATAGLFGPTLSVVGGGLATLLVVATVGAVWPQLARVGPLLTLAPVEPATESPEAVPANTA